jgi:uncharacterized protein (TIGR03435 family)
MKLRSHAVIAVLALLAASVLAQSTPPPAHESSTPPAQTPAADAKNPTFIIADIHPSAPSLFPVLEGPTLRGDRFILRQAVMRDLIAVAYSVDAGFVRGGPSWFESDPHDVIAKMPPGTTMPTARLMLRALLAERFKLVVHNGSASFPLYSLTAGTDKVKMKPSDGSGDSECKLKPPAPNQAPGTFVFELSCSNISMDAFVQDLHNFTRDYILGPIPNSTGLKGTWDFDLKWMPRMELAGAGASGISLYDAIEKQLGLKLEQRSTSMPVILVDSVNKTPTPNSPDLAKILPPLPPPQFEVATIKPTAPGERGSGRITGDELNFQGVPLRFLISFAWNLNLNEKDMIVDAPKWLDSDRIDILAKVSPEDLPVDQDELRQMLRALLTERFQMKTHTEDRPISAYVMTAPDPKLKKADPAEVTLCREGPGPDGKDPRTTNPMLNRLVSCQNMTMAEIAQKLQLFAGGYIQSPIQDDTGLKGGWDFTLSFSSANLTSAAGRGAPSPAGGAPAVSDPNGAVSFFDAVRKQLGLKLDKQTRPEPVLVIDHINEQPTEN